jgi:hypothetical protein
VNQNVVHALVDCGKTRARVFNRATTIRFCDRAEFNPTGQPWWQWLLAVS